MVSCYNFESLHKILWSDHHRTRETSLFQHFVTWNLWNLLNFNCGFLWKFKKMQLTISGLRIGVVSPEDEGEFKRDVCSLSWFTADTKTWKKNVHTKCHSNYSSIFITPGKGKLFHIWGSFKNFRVRSQILTEKKKWVLDFIIDR